MIKMTIFVLNEIKPTGQLYEKESELGESGSVELSPLFIHITHKIENMVLGKLEQCPKK